MSLKPCKECHKEVSTSAKQCPHCGRKHPTGGFTLPAKLFLGFIALVIMAQIARDRGRSSVDVSPGPTERFTPEAVVSADQLFADYHANEVAADSRYKDRMLSLTGVVEGIKKDFLDKTYLTLRTSNTFMTVHATLKSSEAPQAASLSKGDRVHLVCKGNGMVIGSPIVNDCYLQRHVSPAQSEEGVLMLRSMPGDEGRYYLLEKKKRANIIRSLHKRVDVDSVGYTVAETNCETMLMRVLAKSYNRRLTLQDEQALTKNKWFELVPGSSESDLALFVCKER